MRHPWRYSANDLSLIGKRPRFNPQASPERMHPEYFSWPTQTDGQVHGFLNRLHALLADHLQRQGCSYPGTTGQAVIDGQVLSPSCGQGGSQEEGSSGLHHDVWHDPQAALALGSSGTPTTAASRGLDQAASVRASSEEAGTRVATSPRSENTGVVGAAQEDPDCYLHGPESQWERADIPRTSDANWEQAALPNRSLGPPKVQANTLSNSTFAIFHLFLRRAAVCTTPVAAMNLPSPEASKLAGEKAGIPSPQAALPGVRKNFSKTLARSPFKRALLLTISFPECSAAFHGASISTPE